MGQVWTPVASTRRPKSTLTGRYLRRAPPAVWLRDPPSLWAAADDSGRRLLTEALFKKVEVLGVESVTIYPTPEADARGWSEAFGPTPQRIPVEMGAGAIGTDGRGERSSASTSDVQIFRFVEPSTETVAEMQSE